MKFAANLNRLWVELPYLERFEAAADAGFEGVAVPFPYELAAKETQRAVVRSGLAIAQISAPPPNYTGGARGFAAMPERKARFRYDLRRALRYCEVLHVPVLQIMAGTASGEEAHQTLIDNLRLASALAPQGLTLTLEPRAQPGAFLQSCDLAAEIIDAVGVPNLGLQYHSWHAQMLHGDAVEVFKAHASLIRHVQLADAPTGGAPGIGGIAFDRLMEAMALQGYNAWVVADYEVEGRTDDTLAWLKDLRG